MSGPMIVKRHSAFSNKLWWQQFVLSYPRTERQFYFSHGCQQHEATWLSYLRAKMDMKKFGYVNKILSKPEQNNCVT